MHTNRTQIVSWMTSQSLNSKRIESPCLISFRCRVTSTPPTRVVSTSSILATSLMYRLQTCRKVEFRRWKPSIAKGIALHIFWSFSALAVAWLVIAKMLEPRRGICSISASSCLTPIWRGASFEKGNWTFCPSCLWGTWTKLNHLENIPSVWMFCFGCPLASRAPLVRIQDIATAKNLPMRGLQNKQGF